MTTVATPTLTASMQLSSPHLAARKLMKFRVVAGAHIEPRWDLPENHNGVRPCRTIRATPHPDGSWTPSEPFDSPTDLARLHNTDISTKFERVHDETGLPLTYVLPETSRIWDSTKETLEEFVARVKASAPADILVNDTTPSVLAAAKQGFGMIAEERTKVAAAAKEGYDTISAVAPHVVTPPTQGRGGNLPHEGPQVQGTQSGKTKPKWNSEGLKRTGLKQLVEMAEAEEIELLSTTDRESIIRQMLAFVS